MRLQPMDELKLFRAVETARKQTLERRIPLGVACTEAAGRFGVSEQTVIELSIAAIEACHEIRKALAAAKKSRGREAMDA